jgi:hypothetical protein
MEAGITNHGWGMRESLSLLRLFLQGCTNDGSNKIMADLPSSAKPCVAKQDRVAEGSVRLLDNSIAAALSAIEIYNKPDFKYREQVFSILIINAWELLLKAKLVKDSGGRLESLYILKEDGQPKVSRRTGQPLTIEILGAVKKLGLDPAIAGNLETLVGVRDVAVHFYASESLSYLVYTLGAAALQNYQTFVRRSFGKSLLEYNFYILPLAFAYNFKTLALIECDREPPAVAALLKSVAAAQETIESKDFHLVCEISTELRSSKKFVAGTATVSLGVAPEGSDKIVYRTQSLTDKYPLSYYEVIEKVRSALPRLKQHEIVDAIKSLKLKANPSYSAYNFRTKIQQERAKTANSVPSGVTSIYNEDTVRILIQELRKNQKAASHE